MAKSQPDLAFGPLPNPRRFDVGIILGGGDEFTAVVVYGDGGIGRTEACSYQECYDWLRRSGCGHIFRKKSGRSPKPLVRVGGSTKWGGVRGY